MENLEKHYLILLSQEEQEFIKVYFQSLERNYIQTNQKQICDLLVKNPYPVLDILLLKWNKYKYNIKQIMLKTFAELFTKVPSEGFSSVILKFLNRIPEEILQNCLDGELREIMQKCLNEVKLSEEFYLSLLGRETTRSLHDILELLKETHWQYFQNPLGTKEFILYQSLDNKAHFLALIANQITNFKVIKDLNLRNNLIILKLVQEFSTTSQHLSQLPNVEKCLAHFNTDAAAEDLRPIYNYFYRDFKRLTIILNYVEKFKDMSSCITVQDILSKASNLEVMNKYKLLNEYEQTKTFIETSYMWQNATTNSLKEYELQTICHYFILSCVYEIITTSASDSIDNFYVQKLQQLNSLLRQMKNFTLLCQILEDILIFTYLRWEHLQNNSKSSKISRKLLVSTDASYTDEDILPDSSSKTKTKTKFCKKTGFICNSKAFAQLHNFLRTFVTKKLHSADFKGACIENQQRFQIIVDHISDILWKYSLLEKLEFIQNETRQNNDEFYVEPELLSNFVCYHVDAIDHVSSDDEDIQRGYQSHYTSLSRRKAYKKRRRATFCGMIANPKDGVSMEECRLRANALVNSVSNIDPLKRFDVCKNKKNNCEQRSIIVKLMEPPERLATLALSLKCFNDAKQIIENYNLQNSQLNSELEYVEHQQNIKEKLSTIYENYQRQEKQTRNSNEPLATVEQIRNVAARGYEVSKIISVIDNFAQTQRLKQTEATKDLIQKHKQNPQYRFLTQFEESNLNAIIICDLIINLPFNRDILTSILMIIKRHQSIQSSFKETESLGRSKLPKNIGALNFLENVNDCMRLLDGKSIRDLLSDNTFSLRPSKLADELSRIKIFNEIFYKKSSELSRCEDLKTLSVQFQNLKSKYNYHQRFCNYVHHLTRLVQLRDANCEYHIEELLKIDPVDVVGDLIFNCDMTPLEIEAIVTALNLNLVHVIAINICPEMVHKCVSKKRELDAKKQTTIFNYIANFNHLLVYLLRGITNKICFSKEDATINATFLEKILNMTEIERLASLYNGNKVIAALRCDHVNMKLLENIESKKLQLEMLELEIGVQEPKPIKAKRVDNLIKELIREDAKNIYLAPKITDIFDRAKLIHQNFTKIATTRLAKELIETTLHHRQAVQRIPKELRQQLEAILIDITIYAKVSEVMQFETWPQAYDFGLKTPSAIFERLLQLHLYKLCYEWCNVVKLADNFKPQRKNLLNILLSAMITLEDGTPPTQTMDLNSYEYLLHILETFPQTDCIAFLETYKDKFRSMALLKYAIDFLESVAKTNEKEIYKNYKISLIIFEQLTEGIREKFWNLLKFPLLIIEQLIMNAKFEILTEVLQVVREELNKDANSGRGEVQKLCPFCFDKNGNIYDWHAKSNTPLKARFQLGAVESTKASAFILLNFNLYQKDHFLTNHCIDLLLRIYATKALDYQISDTASSSEPCSQSTSDMQQSLDSLCGTFEMPKKAPARSEWIRDEEATHCMCCRRAAFTMLMRRHHCRRCGRVVCFACSTHRMRIPELYEDVDVRICNDCHRLCEDNLQRKHNRDSLATQPEGVENIPVKSRTKLGDRFKWKLSGNITHDKLLREEFCYEHAPSVALCLSILDYHLDKQKCVDLLLFHCRKLEKLIVPNPEVDYELVAKMMNCLALAAKVRGGPAEVETIQEHAEIIISVVQNGCESLIPPDPLNNHGLRKLADSLVQAERWDLALEVHLKCGFPTAGVMAAHGLSCLRVGCFDTAREKFYHCMPKLTSETTNTALSKIIFNTKVLPSTNGNIENVLGLTKDHDINVIRRPQHGPPLLQEILKLIESLPLNKTQPETLQRASIIRSSNTSLVSLLSRRKDTYVKRLQEPALNVLNTLASLKRISANSEAPVKRKVLFRKTRGFEECIYYVLTYGSHADVIKFLMQQNEIMAALKYFLLQKLEPELFIQHILLVHLKKGQLPQLINHLQEFDSNLFLWRTVLLQACRYFETQNLLNSLYQLQLLLDDPIRASMTCVKFYTMNCDNFQQQHANAYHLHNAHLHLQTELENSKWEHINYTANKNPKNETSSRRSSAASIASSMSGGNFKMQLDARSLNAHINTILKQLDVAKFLAKCEVENSTDNILITEKYLKLIRIESSTTLPTLFDNAQEKTQICILILLCGKNIEEGFGLAYRIIHDYKLTPTKIFAATAKVLSRNQRLNDVEKLLNCITSNNGISTRDIDEILSVAINSATNTHEPEVKTALDNLAKKINSVELRISSHIFIGQLKSAYLLANKYKRIADIRKILRHAEASNQIHIKKLCEKKLQMSMSDSPDSK